MNYPRKTFLCDFQGFSKKSIFHDIGLMGRKSSFLKTFERSIFWGRVCNRVSVHELFEEPNIITIQIYYFPMPVAHVNEGARQMKPNG